MIWRDLADVPRDRSILLLFKHERAKPWLYEALYAQFVPATGRHEIPDTQCGGYYEIDVSAPHIDGDHWRLIGWSDAPEMPK